MNRKPTIAACIIFIISLSISFFITVNNNKSETKEKDVEIYITKEPVEIPQQLLNLKQISFLSYIKNTLEFKINFYNKYVHLIIDSYEVEISDIWREILNHFEIFEYIKSVPEAFIRRLILMPTFTGNREIEPQEDSLILKNYPDNDYRSIRYRVSLVPNTIDNIKIIVDYFFNRVKNSLMIK